MLEYISVWSALNELSTVWDYDADPEYLPLSGEAITEEQYWALSEQREALLAEYDRNALPGMITTDWFIGEHLVPEAMTYEEVIDALISYPIFHDLEEIG